MLILPSIALSSAPTRGSRGTLTAAPTNGGFVQGNCGGSCQRVAAAVARSPAGLLVLTRFLALPWCSPAGSPSSLGRGPTFCTCGSQSWTVRTDVQRGVVPAATAGVSSFPTVRSVAHFTQWVHDKAGERIQVRSPPNASRPSGYWTVKQKSLLGSDPPILKFRPIIAHSRHPCRPYLRRVGRALSLLVQLAAAVVSDTRSSHTPIWQMHRGIHAWLAKLPQHSSLRQAVGFDVEDCFLNTPRVLVLQALQYWMEFNYRRRRGVHVFAISKDSNKADHVGYGAGPHFWNLKAGTVRAVVQWELDFNSDFEVLTLEDRKVVLRQALGLPIGGHLSAALVELVALFREHTAPWPNVLANQLSCRYRDNFFVAVDSSLACPMVETAAALTDLLQMPVKSVSRGSVVRCLEVRISFEQDKPVKSVLAFRTDADRQGESGDIESWPRRDDPRLPMVLPGLLTGLAAKLRFYAPPGVRGYAATVRAMYRFVRSKAYPTAKWLRPFALALPRVGARPSVLPRPLRRALGAGSQRVRDA